MVSWVQRVCGWKFSFQGKKGKQNAVLGETGGASLLLYWLELEKSCRWFVDECLLLFSVFERLTFCRILSCCISGIEVVGS